MKNTFKQKHAVNLTSTLAYQLSKTTIIFITIPALAQVDIFTKLRQLFYPLWGSIPKIPF